METSLYIVDAGTKENADTLRKHWFEGAVAVEGGRGTELIIPLTERQADGLKHEMQFTVTPAPAAT